jgi:hypothetical protein
MITIAFIILAALVVWPIKQEADRVRHKRRIERNYKEYKANHKAKI